MRRDIAPAGGLGIEPAQYPPRLRAIACAAINVAEHGERDQVARAEFHGALSRCERLRRLAESRERGRQNLVGHAEHRIELDRSPALLDGGLVPAGQRKLYGQGVAGRGR